MQNVLNIEYRSLDDEQVKGMFEEALIMKQLDHENIVKVTGIALLRNQPHIIMPFMRNKDLKSHISNKQNVSVKLCLSILCYYSVKLV